MNGRWITGLVLAGAALAIGIGGLQLFSQSESRRFNEVKAMASSPSAFNVELKIDYARGRVAEEIYAMSDRNGVSVASYAVTDRSGTTARFHEDLGGYEVSFLFGKLVQDGIWDLSSQPPRGDPTIRYAISVNQTAQEQHGSRSFTFTDPHWWATTAGRQYSIHLDKDKPVPDLLQLSSTSLAEPRYERLVDDFRAFGSPQFKATIQTARRRLGLPG